MGSFRIGRVAGIPIYLHVTLALTLLVLVGRWGAFGLPAGVLLFGSVLLHELGHALVALRHGLRTQGIHLHLLGGVAMMAHSPRKPEQEIEIAAAGPAVSFLLGAVFAVLSWMVGAELRWEAPRWVDLLAFGAALNLGMGLFNLVPALPMDGGRILRAALARGRNYVRATRLAARVSRGFGILFIAVGLWPGTGAWSLVLIGGLLWFMSRREEQLADRTEMMEEAARAARTPSTLPWPPPSLRPGIERVAEPVRGRGHRIIYRP